MQPMPQLLPLLKQLRLSGMQDSLEVRARQAVEQKLPHMDFLALLLGDEIARRDQSKFAQRQRRAEPEKAIWPTPLGIRPSGGVMKCCFPTTQKYLQCWPQHEQVALTRGN